MYKLITTAAVAGVVVGGLAISPPRASAGSWVYDTNGNGIYDTIRVDRWNDGIADIEGGDPDENGILNWLEIDYDNDGGSDINAFDQNQNGMWEQVDVDRNSDLQTDISYFDSNENGIFDNLEAGAVAQVAQVPLGSNITGNAGLITGITDPGWLFNLGEFTISMGGMAALPPGDWDGDGCYDNYDADRTHYDLPGDAQWPRLLMAEANRQEETDTSYEVCTCPRLLPPGRPPGTRTPPETVDCYWQRMEAVGRREIDRDGSPR